MLFGVIEYPKKCGTDVGSSFFVKLPFRSVFTVDFQNVEVRLGGLDGGCSSRFSVLHGQVGAACTEWMGFGQMRLFTSPWIMKRMHSLYEEIDTMEAVSCI